MRFLRRGGDENRARKLRDRAIRLREKGKLTQAAACYRELEDLEPAHADWPKRAAECYRRLGRHEDAIAALDRSAALYTQGGFVLKAIAVCKMALAMDPGHAAIGARLATLAGQRCMGLERIRARPGASGGTAPKAAAGVIDRVEPTGPAVVAIDMARPAPPSVSPRSRRSPSIPPGAPLEAVPLSAVAPAHESTELPQPQGVAVYELDIDLVDLAPEPDSVDFAASTDSAVRDAARALLPHTPLFSDVSEESFRNLIDRVALEQVDAGDVILREGAPADALYVIVEGRADVIAEGPPPTKWGELGDGDFFGEIGLISDAPRQRTVRATESTQLLVLDRPMVSEMVEREPSFLPVLLRFIRERLVDQLTRTSELFAPFAEEDRRDLMAKFRFLELAKGAVLIREGKRAEGLFVLLSGEAEVVQGDAELRLAMLTAGDVFGEMSLLDQSSAVGTVRTTRKSFALLMPGKSFTEAIMAQPHILAYTSELAERRRTANTAPPPGAESRIDLI